MSTDKRKQVAEQCRVVVHLAEAIAGVYKDYASAFPTGDMDRLIDQIGNRTARLMEKFGDILNGMDAVTEEDDWTAPIFAEAHRLWPQRPEES